MQANEYYNWTRAVVFKPFTAKHINPMPTKDGYRDVVTTVTFRKNDQVRLFNWKPEGMEAENVRTGQQIFLFFRHFENLRQLAFVNLNDLSIIR